MTNSLRTRLWFAAGCVLLAVGCVTAIRTLNQLDRDRARWRARLQELEDLYAMEARLQYAETYREAYRRHVSDPPEPDTLSLMATLFPDARPLIRDTRIGRYGEWKRVDVELALQNASIARVFQFIETAERAKPPLRLASGILRSRPGAGHADVVLNCIRLQPVSD